MNLVEVQSEINKWKGGLAGLRYYEQSHSVLAIEFRRPPVRSNMLLMCEACRSIKSPVSWGDVEISVSQVSDDIPRFAVEDSRAGVLVVCDGLRILHDVEPIYV